MAVSSEGNLVNETGYCDSYTLIVTEVQCKAESLLNFWSCIEPVEARLVADNGTPRQAHLQSIAI